MPSYPQKTCSYVQEEGGSEANDEGGGEGGGINGDGEGGSE